MAQKSHTIWHHLESGRCVGHSPDTIEIRDDAQPSRQPPGPEAAAFPGVRPLQPTRKQLCFNFGASFTDGHDRSYDHQRWKALTATLAAHAAVRGATDML